MIETHRLPTGVYLLAFSLFAMGSAEFLMAGVLPSVAADLGVSLSSAGALITAFALGVVLGGPPFAVLSLKWPRRTALMTTQAVFAAAIAAGLLADDYWILLVTRFVAGLAYAGFFAVAAVTAISLVTPDRNARASGVVVAGLSVAMVGGGPAGTLLSNLTDWTGGFWGVVVLTLLGVVACASGLPATAASAEPSLAAELRAMRTPRLWGVYAITVLSTAAYMVSFNYLAAVLADVTRLPAVWIPAALALFGIGAFFGLSLGGRISDRRPHHALLGGALGIALFSALLAVFAASAWLVVPLVFQLGISLTPAFAAGVLNLGASVTAVCWIGAALALVTVPLVILDRSPRHCVGGNALGLVVLRGQ
jgi:DHA1 family chloramphenicol resistance protein-like MFS transporter